MKKLAVVIAAGLVLGGTSLAIANGQSGSGSSRVAASAARQNEAVFKIANMTCPTCPITVKTAMLGVAGVSGVTIDFAAKTARVSFDPARTNTRIIAAASTNAGYPAMLRVG